MLFFTAFIIQLSTSIRLDIFSTSHTTITIMGWYFCFMASLIYILIGIHKKKVILSAVLLALLFMIYVSLRLVLTAGDNFTVQSILISPRYGLLPLAVIGAGSALFFDVIKKHFHQSKTSDLTIILLRSVALMIPLPIMFTCISFIQNPVISIYYQPLTDTTIILFSLMMLFIETLWPSKKPLYVLVIFGSSLTFCVAVIALIGSTSVVAFWLFSMILFIWKSVYKATFFGKLLIATTTIIGIMFVINLPFIQEIALGSRLMPLLNGSFEVTSITSRYALMLTFIDQFSIDPIFGNFKADEYIGLEPGSYVHSIILSLFTHSGIIGVFIFALMVLIVTSYRLEKLDNFNRLESILVIAFFGLGSLYAFFSWPPFWFFLGFLFIKPNYLDFNR